ncbi:MAG: hypothetical protein ACIAQZ_16585 [Sedimentisphaeraceae bacterium JB056]
MRPKLRKALTIAVIVLPAILITGWIYRHRIDSFVCGIAINRIEHKSNTQITYDKLEADFSALSARNVEIESEDYLLSIKTLKLKYDKSIIFRKHKLAYLKNVNLNNFTLRIKDDIDDIKKKELEDSGSKKYHRRIINDILSRFNCTLNIQTGRIIFESQSKEYTIEIEKASLSSNSPESSLNFELVTKHNGLMPESRITGIFEPSLPGYFKANASIKTVLLGNRWLWNDINIDCDWQLDGIFMFNMAADAGDKASINVNFVTNIFEQDITTLEVNTDNIKITRIPAENELYLSDELLDVLGENMSRAFRENHITGTFDTNTVITFMPEVEDHDLNLRIKLKDFDLTYGRFPYSLKGIEGQVIVINKDLDINLKTTKDDIIEISAKAVLDDSEGERHGLDLKIKSESLSVDNDLYEALGQPSKMAWLSFAPKGKAKIDYHLYDNESDRLEYELDIYPISGEVCYNDFAYPLKDLGGRITLRHREVELANVSGHNDNGKVIANGSITGLGQPDADVDLNFECTNIAIKETLVDLLPEKIREKIELLDFENATADTSVKVTNNNGKLIYKVEASAQADVLRYIPQDITFDKAKVEARFINDRLNIESFNASLNEQPLNISGWINIGEAKHMNYDFQFSSESENFEKLAAILTDDPDGKPNITGAVDVNGHIKGSEKDSSYILSLLCRDASIDMGKNIKIENASGSIDIAESKLNYDIKGKLAERNDCSIISTGVLNILEPHNGMLSVEIDGIKPTDPLIPSDLSLAGEGNLKLQLPQAQLTNGVLSCENTQLSFADIDFEGDVITNASGTIKCKSVFSEPNGLHVPEGIINMQSVDVFDRKIERAIARFRFNPQGGFSVSNNMTAKLCDGDISGILKFKPENGIGNYEITLNIFDIDADKLLNAGSEELLKEQFDLDGRISGQMYMKGILGDPESRFGRFNFEVRNVKVTDRTLADEVLDAILSRSSAHTMQKLKVDSYLKGNTIFLDDVSVSLPLMLLRGTGDIDIESLQIKLQLSAQGTKIIDNSFLSELSFLKAIGKTIAKVNITGNVANPKIEVTTLGLFKK